MNNFFNSVHITNFKSLKDVTLSDCKRINLLIGKPNVGKSNILEAIGLFSLPYFKYNKSKKLTQFIRLENIAELFFDGNIDEKITIHTNDTNTSIDAKYLKRSETNDKNENSVSFDIKSLLSSDEVDCTSIVADDKGNLSFKINNMSSFRYYPSPVVKFYKFSHNLASKKQSIHHSYLIPPSGINLLEVIQGKNIEKELSKIFSEYGLKLLFDKTNQTLRIDKPLKENAASFPFSSIADTLQRLVFFKAAIASNKNSILLFEEPEAHCFPPYIAQITQEIIDSETNQFFIATHSPYVLNDFMEDKNTRAELAIYMADFKDGQTVIYRLTDEELDEVYNHGIDVFFNYERFTAHG